MTIKEKRNPYTVHSTPPIVTWTSPLLPVSRNSPEIVMRVPPALGPLDGFTASGLGFWRERGRKVARYIMNTCSCFALQGFTYTRKLQPTGTHVQIQCYVINTHTHTHISAHPPWALALFQKHSHTHARTHTHSYKHHICLNLLSKQLGGALPCGEALAEPEIWKAS